MFPLYFSPIRTTKMLYSTLVDRLWGFSSSLEVGFFLSLQSCVQRAVLGCPAGSDCGSWDPPVPPSAPRPRKDPPLPLPAPQRCCMRCSEPLTCQPHVYHGTNYLSSPMDRLCPRGVL